MPQFDIFLGLGSNLGDCKKNIQEAINKLENNGLSEVKYSSFYKTKPVNCPKNSGDYLNGVLQAKWSKNQFHLLDLLQKVEKDMGRVRSVKNGSRIIDLDILLFGDKIIYDKYLIIPHPRMIDRNFVLYPLVELAPNLIIPNQKLSIVELLNNMNNLG